MSDDIPPAEWPDEEVLAAAETEMPAADDRRLSALLAVQQVGELSDAEREELAGLMQEYQQQFLLKAQGMREAVRRGLRGPLQP